MPKIISHAINGIISFVRGAASIIHYFSDIITIISAYNWIFEDGSVGTVIIWLMIALISVIIAELLKSHLPTPLRMVLRRRRNS